MGSHRGPSQYCLLRSGQESLWTHLRATTLNHDYPSFVDILFWLLKLDISGLISQSADRTPCGNPEVTATLRVKMHRNLIFLGFDVGSRSSVCQMLRRFAL